MTQAEYRNSILESAQEVVFYSAYSRDEWRKKSAKEVLAEVRSDPEMWEHIVHETGKSPDLVSQDLANAIIARGNERDEIDAAFRQLGFGTTGTGGGCEAFYLEVNPPEHWPHFLVTDHDCGLPEFWDEPVVIGYYQNQDSGEEPEEYKTTRELVDLLRQGKGHPAWTYAPSASVQTSDLETVNRHRKRIGAPPIDPSAGWTAEELHQMADNIRKHGREFNPRHLARRLMR